jgi:glutathione S-transferase
MHLYLANKRYSSWSLRPWLVMRAFGIPFEETVIPLKRPETKAAIAAASPSGKVPVLVDGDVVVWESLAIIEYLAERYPERAIWPRAPKARAHARAISNEMHGGFQALRQACPMNLGKRFAAPSMTDDLEVNIARIEGIWREARTRFGGSGPFLYGSFSAADAMFAPIVTRFDTYGLNVADDTRQYMAAILAHPEFRRWREAGLAEPWDIPEYEAGLTELQSFPAEKP